MFNGMVKCVRLSNRREFREYSFKFSLGLNNCQTKFIDVYLEEIP